MGKIKVSEIAKKMGITSAQVIERLKKEGVEVKTASSSVEENVVEKMLNNKESKNVVKKVGENKEQMHIIRRNRTNNY